LNTSGVNSRGTSAGIMAKPGDPNFDPETIYDEPATIRVRIPAAIVDWFKARGEDPKAEIIAALNAYIAANGTAPGKG
jgi:uncharacterized protein (DUF4415 family)